MGTLMQQVKGCHSRRQLPATTLLLLLASSCVLHHVQSITVASGAGTAGDSLPPRRSSSIGHHTTRVLMQQPAIGDDDEFDWSEDTKPSAPTASIKPAVEHVKAQAAQSGAATVPSAAAEKTPPKQERDRQPDEAASKQPRVSDNGKMDSDELAARLPEAKQEPKQQPKTEASSQGQQATAADAVTAANKAPVEDAAAAKDAVSAATKEAAGAGSDEQEQLEADAAAAALDADSLMDEPDEPEPVQDGTPALLGDHTAAAEEQSGPRKQQQFGQEQQQGKQQQQQQDTAGTWVSAHPQAPARHDDVDPAGACKSWVERYCEDVEVGGGQLADCLAQHQAAADSGEDTDKLEPLSADCHEEVLQLKIWRSKSVDSNPALAKACADDISRYCNVTWFAGLNPGSVLACLKDARSKLTPACQKEVFKVQLDAAEDYRADEVLHKACQSDAESLCQGVKHGGGQIQACLMKQRSKLSPDCEYELFRKEVEDAGDIRLSVRLFRACLPDKKQLCADVAPGQALASQCLEEHKESLSDACRDEVDAMIERRVRDFRLDSRLKSACEGTILEMCSELGDTAVLDTYDAAVANCLQDFRDDIKDESCQAQVHKYQELAAQDIRFNPPLADACFKDRMELCAQVPPGSARVIRCLQNQRDKLSSVCRSTLMSEEVRFSENIDFQYPMKQACAKEIERFCDVVPHGGGRVIRCLQDNLKQRGFSKPCKDEVQRYQQESVRDIRLNHRLFRACKEDVGAVCAEACDFKQGEVCGGKVLACLSEKHEQLKSSACRKEVAYLQHMGVQDFRADMQLAEACRPDVDRWCAGVEPGDGRVHKCLRDNYEQLSHACKREEVRLEAQEADNIQLNQGLLRACAAERSLFCGDVQPGSARVFRCLAHNLASAGFGRGCMNAMMSKLRRREANWRLDPPLRKTCTADVESLCAAEDASMQDGAVKQCMIAQADELSTGCRRELGRSLYMAFFIWQPQGVLTAPCDADIQRLCLSRVKEMVLMPGAVEVCLSEIVEVMADNGLEATANHKMRRLLDKEAAADGTFDKHSLQQQKQQHQSQKQQATAAAQLPSSNSTVRYMPRLSKECYQLAALAHLPQAERSSDFAAAAYSLLETSLGRVQEATGLQTLQQDGRTGQVAVSLTGWTALAGMTSLVVVLLGVATWAVRAYTSPTREGYSVVKGAAAA